MPCNDFASSGNAVVILQATHDHQDNQHGYEDACSPFCTCSCCTGVNFKTQRAADTKISFEISSKNPTYISPKAVDISLPIWQPPQLKA